MAFLALVIGTVLLVAAIRDTHGNLFSALKEDVPGFAIWGAAIIALAAIGFVPGLKPVSRGLLALVLVVIILVNYKNIIAGFQGAWQGAQQQASGGASSGGSPDLMTSLLSNLGGHIPDVAAAFGGEGSDAGASVPGMIVNGLSGAG
jgi:hypothetical protein